MASLKEQIRIALGIDKPGVKLAYQDKLEDGTIITSTADELVAGVDISVLTEDGTTIPLPVGEYITEAGLNFRVDEDGLVAEILEEDTEEEAPEEAPEEEIEASEREPKRVKETREVEFDKEALAYKDALISELSAAVKEMVSGLQSQINEVRELLEGNTITLEEEIVSIEAEKEVLSKKVAKLEKAPATEAIKVNKFRKETTKQVVSPSIYRAMSVQDKYWHNLNGKN
jgi:hypothetical protein